MEGVKERKEVALGYSRENGSKEKGRDEGEASQRKEVILLYSIKGKWKRREAWKS